MAIKLENKTNVLAPNGTYPYGNIKDDTGANDGTPVDVEVYADLHQFFAKLGDVGHLIWNNLPDNDTNGFQLFQALETYVSETITAALLAANTVTVTNTAALAVIPFTANRHNLEFANTASGTAIARTFTYNFTGAAIGKTVRLHMGAQAGTTFTFIFPLSIAAGFTAITGPAGSTVTAGGGTGATITIQIGVVNTVGRVVVEFVYLGTEPTTGANLVSARIGTA